MSAPPLRILLSEGSSQSARQAITTLGLAGHHIEVCDPAALSLGRCSRFVRRYHRCPGMGVDPQGYLDFIAALAARRRFDVLLPVHEQAFLFARHRERLPPSLGLALADFTSFRRVQAKTDFSLLLDELGLPQPLSKLARSIDELLVARPFPFYLKIAFGTASRGVWRIEDRAGQERAAREIADDDGLAEPCLVQELAPGTLERSQAVFDRGRLVAAHAYRQVAVGVGGGDIIKLGVSRPVVRDHLARIGRHLNWHGAFALDYMFDDATATPAYIDANPRLVEPVNGMLSGIDLAGLVVRISVGEAPPTVPEGKAGVRTHMAVQALLACAQQRRSRIALLAECWRLLTKRAPYAGSVEELTPLRQDWLSVVPLIAVLVLLLANPARAREIAHGTARSHQISPLTLRYILNRQSAIASQPS